MKTHDNGYRFNHWGIRHAKNGFIVECLEGSGIDSVLVFSSIHDVVSHLISHCGLTEHFDEEITLVSSLTPPKAEKETP